MLKTLGFGIAVLVGGFLLLKNRPVQASVTAGRASLRRPGKGVKWGQGWEHG